MTVDVPQLQYIHDVMGVLLVIDEWNMKEQYAKENLLMQQVGAAVKIGISTSTASA